MEGKEALNDIIKGNHGYWIEYAHGLANHLPMTVIAMYKALGDSSETVEAMKGVNERYLEKLEPYAPKKPLIDFHQISQERRLTFLGNGKYFSSWYGFFEKEIDTSGVDSVLKTWMPILVKGLSGGAGHCLLRTYFCLLAKDDLEREVFEHELIVSLSYFASDFLQLGEYDSNDGESNVDKTTDLALTNDQVSLGDSAKDSLVNSHLISTRLKVISWDDSFQALRKEHHVTPNFRQVLKGLAAQAIKKPDFSLLHNITVGQATLDLLEMYPYLNDTVIKEAYVDFVLSVYYLRQNSYNIESESDISQSFTADEIRKRILLQKDSHSIKSAFSLLELYKRMEEPVFLAAADAFMLRYK